MREQVRGFLDQIFGPPKTFLDLAIEKLQNINLVTAQGLNLSTYTSVFGDLPQAWQLVINSLFISLVLLGSLILFKSVVRMYFAIKEGVKWW